MTEEARRAIAYIAVYRITGQDTGAIFSYDTYNYSRINITPTGAFDWTISRQIVGSDTSYFHHGTGGCITLFIEGNTFHGYDLGSFSFYRGEVTYPMVQIYDCGDARYHGYFV